MIPKRVRPGSRQRSAHCRPNPTIKTGLTVRFGRYDGRGGRAPATEMRQCSPFRQDRRRSTGFSFTINKPLLVHTLVCLAPVVPTGQHRTHARWSRKRPTNTTEVRSNPTERACVPATTASVIPACCAGGENRGSEGGAHADGAPHGAGGCSARHVLSPHPSPQRATPRRKGGTG